jgi:two-component system chemotaxis sensor kinase CheA
MLNKLKTFLVLPAPMSAFEVAYLARMNRVGLIFFALHVPAFMLVAWVNQTGPLSALALTTAVLVGPALAYLAFQNPRAISTVYGFTAMLMGGLLVHFGQGPVQIEMHFYFFALLAMLAVYGNPMVIVTAAITVALHHLALWALAPASVFNYGAPLWVVIVHASFVALESIATCFIARSFFDNVIGLEKIVQARTAELAVRNGAMRLVLDNVRQGFLTIDRDGVMSSERSRVLASWLGEGVPGQRFAEYLEPHVPRTAQAFVLGWGEVIADIMPLELTLLQLPDGFSIDQRHFKLEYAPIMGDTQLEKVLVVISDITSEVERERLELEQRDVMQVISHLTSDKSGVLEFFQEGSEQVAAIVAQHGDDRQQRRVIHTLKGNAMIFGVQSIARLCERAETRFDELGVLPSEAERAELSLRWSKLCESLSMLLGEREHRIELDDAEYEAILAAVLRGDAREKVAAQIRSWRLEPTLKRLMRVGEQARALAVRTGKGPLEVEIEDHQLRLDNTEWAPFWSAFVHVVRNAVDHGLEYSRTDGRKSTIALTTRLQHDELVIELSDNGRGIDWARIAAQASARGLPYGSRSELVEALFADGLSTATEVNEYSGRGIGMAAVRAACVARGGTMNVTDREGGGTRVQFRFPHAQSRPMQLVSSL